MSEVAHALNKAEYQLHQARKCWALKYAQTKTTSLAWPVTLPMIGAWHQENPTTFKFFAPRQQRVAEYESKERT